MEVLTGALLPSWIRLEDRNRASSHAKTYPKRHDEEEARKRPLAHSVIKAVTTAGESPGQPVVGVRATTHVHMEELCQALRLAGTAEDPLLALHGTIYAEGGGAGAAGHRRGGGRPSKKPKHFR